MRPNAAAAMARICLRKIYMAMPAATVTTLSMSTVLKPCHRDSVISTGRPETSRVAAVTRSLPSRSGRRPNNAPANASSIGPASKAGWRAFGLISGGSPRRTKGE